MQSLTMLTTARMLSYKTDFNMQCSIWVSKREMETWKNTPSICCTEFEGVSVELKTKLKCVKYSPFTCCFPNINPSRYLFSLKTGAKVMF